MAFFRWLKRHSDFVLHRSPAVRCCKRTAGYKIAERPTPAFSRGACLAEIGARCDYGSSVLILRQPKCHQHQTATKTPLLTSSSPPCSRQDASTRMNAACSPARRARRATPFQALPNSPQSTPTQVQEPDQLRRSNNHRPRPRGDDSGCVGGGVDKRGDRRGEGRPKSGLEQPSGPPRERGRRRGLRRVGDSRPGRGDLGDKLEKDAGLRAPGTRRGES